MKLDKKTLLALDASGVGFMAGIPTPGGQETFPLQTNDLADYVADKELWFARKNGVSKEDYLRWLAADGTPQCGYQLKNGRRCKNTVSG